MKLFAKRSKTDYSDEVSFAENVKNIQANDPINYTHVITELIRDELINIRFLNDLPEEFDTSPYFLNLHQSIFELMGLSNYSDMEELTDWYFKKTEQAISMDYRKLDELVLDIYAGLKAKYHGKN